MVQFFVLMQPVRSHFNVSSGSHYKSKERFECFKNVRWLPTSSFILKMFQSNKVLSSKEGSIAATTTVMG